MSNFADSIIPAIHKDKQKADLSLIPLLSSHKKLILPITDNFINLSVDNDITHEDDLTS